MKLRILMVCSNVCDIYIVLMFVILCSNVCDIVCALVRPSIVFLSRGGDIPGVWAIS